MLVENAVENKETWVVAIGGHSLKNPEDVIRIISQLLKIAEERNAIISLIVHGSGPQAGAGMDEFLSSSESEMTVENFNKLLVQGNESAILDLGGEIKTALENLGQKARITITRCLVDPKTMQPRKPVGRSLKPSEVEILSRILTVDKVDDNGARVLIPSPLINEVFFTDLKEVTQTILQDGTAIGGGSGGVPFIEENGVLKPVAAVIDKDWALAKLVEGIGPVVPIDKSIILTRAPALVRNFSVIQRAIEEKGFKEVHDNWLAEFRKAGLIQRINLEEAEKLYAAGIAVAGAGPKLGGSIEILKTILRTNTRDSVKEAIICAPENLEASLDGTEDMGTVIYR